MLRETGDLVHIQASGDAVEVLPGNTPEILQGRAAGQLKVPAPTPGKATAPAPAPTPKVAGAVVSRTAESPSEDKAEPPTGWPTWIDESYYYEWPPTQEPDER